jgi:16S rRNA U516 pseudouridylate synthase RsuA-like enzyme
MNVNRGGDGTCGGFDTDNADVVDNGADATINDVDDSDIGRNNNVRLNKVFKATHSRRAADELIKSGRVSVNGVVITGSSDDAGTRVVPYRDVVTLDGNVVRDWEGMNAITIIPSSSSTMDRCDSGIDSNDDDMARRERRRRRQSLMISTSTFEYVKYHKPLGVTCTTDLRIRDNIIDSIRAHGYAPRHRVYPVGRLDKETSGLILLTSDGRVVNSVLRGENKMPKVYDVMVNGNLKEDDLRMLRVRVVNESIERFASCCIRPYFVFS